MSEFADKKSANSEGHLYMQFFQSMVKHLFVQLYISLFIRVGLTIGNEDLKIIGVYKLGSFFNKLVYLLMTN